MPPPTCGWAWCTAGTGEIRAWTGAQATRTEVLYGPQAWSTDLQSREGGPPHTGDFRVLPLWGTKSTPGTLTEKLPAPHGRGVAVPGSGQWWPAGHSTQATASLAPRLWREVPLKEKQRAEMGMPTAFPGGTIAPASPTGFKGNSQTGIKPLGQAEGVATWASMEPREVPKAALWAHGAAF